MSTVLRRNLILACPLFFLISLAARPASAQSLLSLQSGDNVIISGTGTTGIYLGKTVNNKISSYSNIGSYSTISCAVNSTVALQQGGSITNTDQNGTGGGLEAGGNVIVSGGSITSDGEYALGDFSSSNYVTINGGIISGGAYGLASFGPVTITGGTIFGYDWSVAAFTGSTVAISGGNFTSTVATVGGTIIIAGGVFSGANYGNGDFGGQITSGYNYGGTVDLLGSSFTYTPGMYSANSGVSTTISAGFIPQGSGTITGTLADGETLNTTYNSDGTMMVNGNLPSVPVSPAWGAKVTVMLKGSPIPIADRLVSYDGTNIVFAKDLAIDDTGYVFVNNSFPIADIASIKFTDPNDQKPSSILDKYILIQSDDTTITARLTGFSNNKLTFLQQSINGHTATETPPDGGISCLSTIAIPRVNGSDDPAAIKTILDMDSYSYIPPHILYGLAWDESYWHQYDPNTGATLVTFDGGIGLFQHTQATAAFTTNPEWDGVTLDQFPQDTLSHLYHLASDTSYNAQSGADLLVQKLELTFDKGTFIGDGSPMFLEHWLKAVNLYNGNNLSHYQRIINAVATAPYGQGIEKVTLSSPQIVAGKAAPTSYPAHADVNFDGVVDLTLQAPKYSVDPSSHTITIRDLAAPNPGNTISSADIYVTDSNGNTVADVTTVLPGPQSIPVTIGGNLGKILPKGQYTGHISVVLSNGEADGATFPITAL